MRCCHSPGALREGRRTNSLIHLMFTGYTCLVFGDFMFWFLLHSICSVLAALLAIFLGISAFRKDFKHHRGAAFAMLVFALIGLLGSFFYGFSIDWTNIFSASQLHSIFGFAALLCSLLPFLFRKSRFHCWIAYLAAFLAALSILTGLLAYSAIIFAAFSAPVLNLTSNIDSNALASALPSAQAAPSLGACITFDQMRSMNRCVFAVDKTVYDMSNMPGWQSGGHYGHLCGGSITKSELLALAPSHTSAKYFGPVAGHLC